MAVTLSIVIPIYNEQGNLQPLFARLERILVELGLSYEIVCVNDGSQDASLEELVLHHLKNPAIKVVNLSRNFGKEIALSAGIDHAQGKAVIPIDADLQDPPELIEQLVEQWQAGHDVVYATRRSRQGETWFKRFTAQAFYNTITRLSPVNIPANTGDFRLMDRRVVEALKKMPERTRFMKGMFTWVGYRQTAIFFDRHPRLAGQSTWNYWKLWNFALDGITSFSTVPLKVWLYAGMTISVLALLYALVLIGRTLLFGADVQGYASLMVAILFFGGVQLITLGVIGEYLGRVYEEVKGRPLYFVRDTFGFE
ncbi:MAG: glycosyltransferase family 2 protein [Cyanobacteria bacterium P01_G01_bin.54]